MKKQKFFGGRKERINFLDLQTSNPFPPLFIQSPLVLEHSLEREEPKMEYSEEGEVISSLLEAANERKLNDVTVYVGKERKEFYVSSFLLGARSEVFKKMFFLSELKEQQTKEWTLEDLSPNFFPHFLQFLYSGRVSITPQVTFTKPQKPSFLYLSTKGKKNNFLVPFF